MINMNTFQTKLKTLLCGLFLLSISFTQAAESDWLTSIEAGMKQAKAEKKLILVEFTGSDWCPPCMMMHKKVFSKDAFITGAKANFVLVILDMPNSNKELKKANGELMKKFKVSGVPTVLLMNADGSEFSRFTASEHRTIETFLARLKKEVRRKDMI